VCPYAIDSFATAGKCAILQLGSAKVIMSHDDPTGAFGTVCMAAAGSELIHTDGQIVRGDLLAVTGATIPHSASVWTQGTVNLTANLATEVSEAFALREQIEALPCDVTYSKISSHFTGTFDTTGSTRTPGYRVICFREDSEITVNTVLTGTGANFVVFKLDRLKLDGAKVSLQAPLTQDKVIWYIPKNTGTDVDSGGSGGGLGCCEAELAGNILAIGYKVSPSPATSREHFWFCLHF
jgi:hypothetical protein